LSVKGASQSLQAKMVMAHHLVPNIMRELSNNSKIRFRLHRI